MSAPAGFLRAYIAAALFSTTDESTPAGGFPLDSSVHRMVKGKKVLVRQAFGPDDIAPETQELMRKDCDRFCELFQGLLDQATCDRPSGSTQAEKAGHDFWMNRNGHGVGFWDGDWKPRSVGEELSRACKTFRETGLYVGDDGKLHAE